MFLEKLDRTVQKNNSLLCVGLDIDPSKVNPALSSIFNFNRAIIDATRDLVCAYKPNIAFYEMHGIEGLSALMQTIEYIHGTGIPVILDAKRGDIGHSSAAYAKSIFDNYNADATTVSPYMGSDSVAPFLEYKDKGIFVLCLTSNAGAKDFQNTGSGEPLYKLVAKKVKEWDRHGNCGLVVGATKPEELKEVQKITGDMPILIPGVGAQGGDLESAVKYGGKRPIINASRSIIYAADPRAEAVKLKDQINKCQQ